MNNNIAPEWIEDVSLSEDDDFYDDDLEDDDNEDDTEVWAEDDDSFDEEDPGDLDERRPRRHRYRRSRRQRTTMRSRGRARYYQARANSQRGVIRTPNGRVRVALPPNLATHASVKDGFAKAQDEIRSNSKSIRDVSSRVDKELKKVEMGMDSVEKRLGKSIARSQLFAAAALIVPLAVQVLGNLRANP